MIQTSTFTVINSLRNIATATWLMLAALRISVDQQAHVNTVTLPKPNSTVNDNFTNVIGVQEIAGGIVLVSDGRENRIVVADLASQVVQAAARSGNGPGEYMRVGTLHALKRDTTIMVDIIGRRWIVFKGDKAVGTLTSTRQGVRETFQSWDGSVLGADTLGNVLTVAPEPYRPGAHEMDIRDSIALVLVSRTSGMKDTVARLLREPVRQVVTMNNDGKVKSVSVSIPAWSVGEQALLCTDGWTAVVRQPSHG